MYCLACHLSSETSSASGFSLPCPVSRTIVSSQSLRFNTEISFFFPCLTTRFMSLDPPFLLLLCHVTAGMRYFTPGLWKSLILFSCPKHTPHIYITVRLLSLKYHFVKFDSSPLSLGHSFSTDADYECITGVLVMHFRSPEGTRPGLGRLGLREPEPESSPPPITFALPTHSGRFRSSPLLPQDDF